MPDGHSANILTSGTVAVGGTAVGEIDYWGDRDWFAVELVAGRTYTIDLRGSRTDDGTLSDPYLRGIHDAEGNLISGTTNDDGGAGYNSRVTFSATETGTYYIAAGAYSGRGTYEVEVTEIAAVQEQTTGDAPVFDYQGYAFALAENANGSTDRVSLGTVSATDTDNDPVAYSIEGGNESGSFEIDAASGELFYVGTGEDYETGSTRFDLTVRASDGTNSTDATVVVDVSDVAEAPAFGQESYAFSLAENADGGTDRVSLGTVTATDPDNDTVAYSIEGGNESGSFEIDTVSGELFYVGAGEDYEAGAAQFDLTIRASDGTLTADAAVSVAITDVPEQTIFGPADPENLQSVSEPYGEDLPTNASTIGRVAVGGTATGNIGRTGDRDGFAVELVAGRTYIIDLRGSPTGDGTLNDPYLRGIKGPDGSRIAGVSNDDGGEGYNSQLNFTPTESGTHYIIAGAYSGLGTYEVELTEIAAVQEQTTGDAPVFDYQGYAFALAENANGSTDRVSLGTVSAADTDNDPVVYSIEGGNESGSFEIDAASGELFYVGTGEDYETGSTRFDLTVRASDGTNSTDATVVVDVSDVAEAPAFGQESYAFSLAENADGGTDRVSLGTVTATDPDNAAVVYSIEGGNASGLFEIDAQTGELFYVGAGEDYEAGATQFDLTIRASGGTLTADAAVSVAITDVPEQTIVGPADPESLQSVSEPYGEDLPTNTSTIGRVAVGGTATGNIGRSGDRDGFAVELVAGRTYIIDLRGSPTSDGTLNDPYLRGIKGPDGRPIAGVSNDDGGEGYNSQLNFTPTESGTHYIIAGAYSGLGTYEVEVRDISPQTAQQETENGPPAFGQASYEFTLAENADGGTNGVSLGTVTATDPDDDPVAYSIEGGNESGSFEIDAASGELFYVGSGEDYETDATRFDLTVQASDGTNSIDTTVIVNVTDVHESSVSEPEGTDFPENFYTPGRVVVGGSASGRLESTVTSLDSDWFAVELTAGRTYVFDLETGFPHVRLDIHDANGVAVERGRWGSYTPSESGTYYVAVRSASYSSSATYTLGVIDDTDEDASRESANDLGDITTIDDLRLATASIGDYVDEVDYYRFTLSAPKAVTLELLEQDADANLILEDEDGNILHSSHGAGRADETISATLLAGTYFVRINAQQSRNANDYVFRYGVSVADSDEVARLEAAVGAPPASVPEPEGLEFPASVDTPGRLLVGESVTGRIDLVAPGRSDADWFAITVDAGRIYRVDLEGSETERGTLRNPELHMYDSEGRRFDWSLGANDEGTDLNSRVYFVPSESGTYYVAASGGLGTYPERTSTGTYTLTLADVTERTDDDHPHDASTTGRVNAGGSVMGEIEEAGDVDWFAVTLVGGVSYRIDLQGSHSGQGTLSDPFLRGIYDSAGNIIEGTANDDHYRHNRDSRAAFTPSESGEYYLAASTWGEQTGTYQLSVGSVTDDYAADSSTNATVAVGGSATGEIDHEGDVDWFALELAAEQTYRIDVLAVGALYDTYIEGVYDADGNLLADSANEYHGYASASATSFVTPSESGTHYVAAGTRLDRLGTYTVRVEAVEDPHSADTGTTGMVSVNGAVSSAIDFPGDVDWFAVTLVQGRTYRFDIRGPVDELGQLGLQLGFEGDRDVLVDPFLTLYDGDGTFIRDSDYQVHNDVDGFFFERAFSFTATQSGTYYAGVSTPNTQSPDSTGMYRLTVTDEADDYANDTSTTGAITVGGAVAGVIGSRDDADWFAATLESGKSYQIRLRGWESDGGTLTDPSFNGIYDSSGSLIVGTSNDDSSFNERGEFVVNNLYDSFVTFTAEDDGVHYLSAGGSPDLNPGQVPHYGTYTMSIEEVL